MGSCPTSGSMTGTDATCIKNCAALSSAITNGAQGTCGAAVAPGHTCKQTCSAGYTLTAGGTMTCPSGGTTLTGTAATCTKNGSPPTPPTPPSPPSPCTVSDCASGGSSMSLGATCSPTCKAGTTLIGVATCQHSGTAVCTSGCHASCAKGNSCIAASTASACTACATGLSLKANHGMSYGQCLWGGGVSTAYITQQITIAKSFLPAANFTEGSQTKNGYLAAYSYYLTGTKSGATVKASLTSRRASDSVINYHATVPAKYASAANTVAKAKNLANFVAAFNAVRASYGLSSMSAADVKKMGTATVSLSSASSTTITGMVAVMVAVLGWTQQ